MKKILAIIILLSLSLTTFGSETDLFSAFQQTSNGSGLFEKLNKLVSMVRSVLSPLLTLGIIGASFAYFRREDEGRMAMRAAIKGAVIALAAVEIVNLLSTTLG